MRRAAVLLGVLLSLGALSRAEDIRGGIAKARALMNAGDTEGCVVLLRELREAAPDDPRPIPLLAFVLFHRRGEIEEAAVLFTEYLESESRDKTAAEEDWVVVELELVGTEAFDTGRPAIARGCAKVLMRARPKVKEFRFLWAQASYRMGERDSAHRACRELLLDYPSYDRPYYLLVRVHLYDNKPEDAEEVYRRLIEERPGDVNARLSLGSLLQWNLKKYEEAASVFRQALAVAGEGTEDAKRVRAEMDRLAEMRAQVKRAQARYSLLGWILLMTLASFAVLVAVLIGMTRSSSG